MIPAAFLARMRHFFDAAEYERFCTALEAPPVRALRVNTEKTGTCDTVRKLPFVGAPLPFAENAFYATEEKVGAHPAHHAGMFYMQDPSAICAVAAVPDLAGLRVLDLCAAPGGKSTQLAAAIGKDGVLVSNEYVPARCRILQGNVERMGLKNTIVTNLDTAKLAAFYGACFDLVVADAPCSGEGMLRKYEVAGEEWSEENLLACATRQREILENAAKCVAPGGRLLYSTCTFSKEENEENVAWFLDTHPEFSLTNVTDAVAAVTADGIPAPRRDLLLCRRFYPHLSSGEGQFLALMIKESDGKREQPQQGGAQPPTAAERRVLQQFLADTCKTPPVGEVVRLRDTLYFTPSLPYPTAGVFATGVAIGTVKGAHLLPHHHFYTAYGTNFQRQLNLSLSDPRVMRYLRGEEIDAAELAGEKNGFACVLLEGAPLGGGKLVDGRLKNHYPKGLRNRD